MFKKQIKLLRKIENVEVYYYYYTGDYDDKESKLKVFKVKLAQFSNIIDEELFTKIFGDTLETLASKLINTMGKEEYQVFC